MAAATAAAIGRDLEAGGGESLRERGVRFFGPYGEDAFGRECGPAAGQRLAAVERIVRTLGDLVGAFVKVEHDGIEVRARSVRDHPRHVVDHDADPRIEHGTLGQHRERPAIPFLDDRVELGNDNLGLWRQCIERGAQRVGHAEPANQHAGRLARQRFAREGRERLLRLALGARHQHAAIDHDQKLAVALAQLQRAVTRRDRREGLPGLHRRLPAIRAAV